MKNKNDVETAWQQNQEKHLNAAIGFYELQMLEEAEAELMKIAPEIADQSIPILTLRLAISYCRCDWQEMKTIARNLFLLDASNPRWAFADGFATAKFDSLTDAEEQNRD